MIKHYYPWVKIVPLKNNYGFAKSSNIGSTHALGDFLVFLNNDTKVEKKWLLELVKVITSDNSIATCGSKIFFYNGNIINHAGASITLLGNVYDIGFGQKDSQVFNELKYVGSTCGGSMIIRKDIFFHLGGFDPDFFACAEDVDLCLRAWIYGFKNIYVPTSIMYHKYGSTLGKRQSAWRIHLCQKNRLINILKNFSAINVVKGFCISVPYDIIRFLMFSLRKDIKTAFSLVKAYIDVLLCLEQVLQKRKIIQKNRKISDNKLIEMGIITPLTDGLREFIRLNRIDNK